MKSSSVLLAAGAAVVAVTLAACDGLKKAMTAHVDTVTRAGSQELSVDRLAALLGKVTVPPRKEVANAIASVWLDDELLGQAAAKGDTTVSNQTIDDAMWAAIAGIKARKYYEIISKTWGGEDTAAARRMYDNGDILSASHILLLTKDKPDAVKASAKRKAYALRPQLTAANFAELARKNSQDPGSASRGGALGLFKKGQMVPAFEQALLALKPGEISPVIETEYGYHIIRRPTYDEVKPALVQAAKGSAMQKAESAFVANLQKNGKMELRPDAASTARVVVVDPDAHMQDESIIANSIAGKFTAGRLAQWLQALPPSAMAQQRMRLQTAPDSVLNEFVKQFLTNELVLHAADSAKLGPTPQELDMMRKGFMQSRDVAWVQLGIDPKTLADSAKTPSAREHFAATRIDAYLDKLVTGQARFVSVPPPLSHVLREESSSSINPAGIDRAVERAAKVRAASDSVRRATEPPSAVPMPSGPPEPAGAPSSAQPGTKKVGS